MLNLKWLIGKCSRFRIHQAKPVFLNHKSINTLKRKANSLMINVLWHDNHQIIESEKANSQKSFTNTKRHFSTKTKISLRWRLNTDEARLETASISLMNFALEFESLSGYGSDNKQLHNIHRNIYNDTLQNFNTIEDQMRFFLKIKLRK